MRAYIAISFIAGICGCLLAACGAFDSALEASDGSTYGGGSAAGGNEGDAGFDVHVGEGGNEVEPFTYAQFCGGGCTPDTAVPSGSPCTVDGEGGAGGAVAGDCSLVIGDNGAVNGECTPKNPMGTDTAPCFTAEDCAPGFACVDDGKCRANCCGNVELCPADTYCTLREPADDDVPVNVVAPQIPVCELADNCQLFEPNGGGCTDGKVCSIVRADGTTACVEPGQGASGDPCPCQAGFVCGYSLNKCFQLCSLQNDDCPTGYLCQHQGYRQQVGICVSE